MILRHEFKVNGYSGNPVTPILPTNQPFVKRDLVICLLTDGVWVCKLMGNMKKISLTINQKVLIINAFIWLSSLIASIWCVNEHVCMGGHMEHGPYPWWHYVIDVYWRGAWIIMVFLSFKANSRTIKIINGGSIILLIGLMLFVQVFSIRTSKDILVAFEMLLEILHIVKMTPPSKFG